MNEYSFEDLSTSEAALTIRLSSILRDDYLLQENKVFFADISHNVPNMVVKKDGSVNIYLSRKSGNVQQVLNIYNDEFRLFDGFVKDFARNYIYQKIAQFVPSSTKQGAGAI